MIHDRKAGGETVLVVLRLDERNQGKVPTTWNAQRDLLQSASRDSRLGNEPFSDSLRRNARPDDKKRQGNYEQDRDWKQPPEPDKYPFLFLDRTHPETRVNETN